MCIRDSDAPVITCPSAFNAGTNTACTYVGAFGTATATDHCDASVTVTNNAPAAFPLGGTTVIWKATDNAGNTATCSQLVTISDDDAPVITCPVAFNAGTNTACTYVGGFGTATATDHCDASVTISNNAPAAFPLGGTTVIWTATDDAGNTATCSQLVTISDDDAPVITCPVAFNAGTNTACTYVGGFGTATATDHCDASVTISNNAPAAFPLGGTTVIWTATDDAGNTATCSQLVTISDDDAPVITCPVAFNAGTNTACTYVGGFGTATATDHCDASVTISNNAPAAFPLGGTTVIWTATDDAGNTATCSQLVTISDDDAPVITCPVAFNAGTNTACTYVGGFGTATATDHCDASVTITNNAPAAFPLGGTTVIWTATDDAGNTATCSQLVTISDDDAPVI